MEILTKENMVGAERTFHSLTEGNQVCLVRTHFSHPESDEKSADVGGGDRIGMRGLRPRVRKTVSRQTPPVLYAHVHQRINLEHHLGQC